MRRKLDEYFMGVASEVMRRCNCLRHAVGAIIVVGGQIVSAGYSGTTRGHENCMDGGCERCATDPLSGANYDTCLCVHAEQNAFIAAARHGVRVEGGTLYTSRRPCFNCLKEAIQAGIKRIAYAEDWRPANAKALGVYTRYQHETEDFMEFVDLSGTSAAHQVRERAQEHDDDVVQHLLDKAIARANESGRASARAARAQALLAEAGSETDYSKRMGLYRRAAEALGASAPKAGLAGRRALDIYFALAGAKWSGSPAERAPKARDSSPASRSPRRARSAQAGVRPGQSPRAQRAARRQA